MTLYDFIQQMSYMSGRFEYQRRTAAERSWNSWKDEFAQWLHDQPPHERQDKTLPYTADGGKDPSCCDI